MNATHSNPEFNFEEAWKHGDTHMNINVIRDDLESKTEEAQKHGDTRMNSEDFDISQQQRDVLRCVLISNLNVGREQGSHPSGSVSLHRELLAAAKKAYARANRKKKSETVGISGSLQHVKVERKRVKTDPSS